jgi:hypothetical protein
MYENGEYIFASGGYGGYSGYGPGGNRNGLVSCELCGNGGGGGKLAD